MPFALPAAATAMAAAAPAAAASAAASATLTSTLISVASQAAVSMAINAAMSALSPKVGAAGRPVDWTLNPDGPIPFAFGRVGVAGAVVHKRTFGPDKIYYGFVSCLSGAGPITGFDSFTADDFPVTFGTNGIAVSSEWTGEMWRVTSLGAQPASFLPSPAGLKNSAVLPDWTSAHRASGKALSILVMGENSKRTAYPNGEVKPLEIFRGLKCWDPRLDSTYPGGSGACRLDNPATWVYSENPIICALRWCLGLWEDAVGKGAPHVGQQVGGIGSRLSGIDVPAFVAAANICDANSWTCAAYPNTDDDKHQVLVSFLQAGGAIYAQRAGKISLIQRAAPRASVVTITADDVIGAIEIDTAASRIDRINTIQPSYWAPEFRWQVTALPEVTAAAYREQDGGKRSRGVTYPFVTKAKQAAQLAALDIAHTREGMAGQVTLKPHLQRILPGDAFTISEPGFLLDGLKCLCMSTEYDPAEAVVRVTFISETDAKYPFALGQSTTPPTPPTLVAPNPLVSPPEPGDWTVTVRLPSEGGSQIAVFDLTGEVTNTTATGLIVEISPDGADPWQLAWSGPPTATNVPISGMQPGVSYFVGISNQRGQNISSRLILGPYETPEIVALSPDESEALERLARIEDDNWLTKGEKPDVIEKWNTVFNERLGIEAALAAAGLTATLATYSDAADDLSDFLSSLDPAWNDLDEDTPLTGASLRNLFMAYYVAKQQANQALAAVANAAAAAAMARINAMTSDSLLSRDEKPGLIGDWQVIVAEYPGYSAQALAIGATAARADLVTAYGDLSTYLSSLSPAYNDLTQDTPIVPATFSGRFQAYYVARAAVTNAMIGLVQADADAANQRHAIIASDNWLSRGEKASVVQDYAAILGEYVDLQTRATTLGVTTPLTTYNNALTALNTYLGGLSPPWNNLAEDTVIVGSTYRQKWADYYAAKSALLTALAAAVGATAQAAQDAIARISSDDWLTAGEKPEVVRQRTVFLTDYPGLQARATALGLTSALANHGNAVNAMRDYLDGLSPPWNSLTTDTVIVGVTLRSRFTDCYTTKQALENAISNAIGADAAAAQARLDVIAADGWLSRNEKPRVMQDYAVVVGEYVDLITRGNAAGASGQVTAYSNAITNLNNYLFGLSPAYDNLSADTAISGPTFRSRWADYYAAKTALQTAISTASGGSPLRIAASSRGIARNVSGPGTYTTTTSITFTISGGSGNYAWEFFLLPANSNGPNAASASISGTSGTGASAGTTFTATVAAGETVFGSFGFEARDTVTGAKTTSLHTGRIVNTA